jgi:hypothetical protein
MSFRSQSISLILVVGLFNSSIVEAAPKLKLGLFLRACKAGLNTLPVTKKASKYYSEIKETKGRRIFSLKDNETSVRSPKSMWFRTPNLDRMGLFPKKALKFTERWPGGPYVFRPIKAISSGTWGNITEKFFGVREMPSGFSKFLGGLILVAMVYGELDHLQTQKDIARIEKYKDFFNFFLLYDYRAIDIRESWEDGSYDDILQAHMALFQELQEPYIQWFLRRDYYRAKPIEDLRKELVDFRIFQPFHDVVVDGVYPRSGFIVPKESQGRISDMQVKQLFDQGDQLAIIDEYITRLVHSRYVLEDTIDPGLFTSDLKTEILNDPLNQELLALHQNNKLSLGELVYGMEENEYWKSKFESYRILHVTRLDVETGQPLTMEVMRNEIKGDISNHVRKNRILFRQWDRGGTHVQKPS